MSVQCDPHFAVHEAVLISNDVEEWSQWKQDYWSVPCYSLPCSTELPWDISQHWTSINKCHYYIMQYIHSTISYIFPGLSRIMFQIMAWLYFDIFLLMIKESINMEKVILIRRIGNCCKQTEQNMDCKVYRHNRSPNIVQWSNMIISDLKIKHQTQFNEWSKVSSVWFYGIIKYD